MASQNRATRATKTRTTNLPDERCDATFHPTSRGKPHRQFTSLTSRPRPARVGRDGVRHARAPRKTGEIRVTTGEVRWVPHPGLVSRCVRSRLGRALMCFSDGSTSRPTPTDRRAPALFPREDGRSGAYISPYDHAKSHAYAPFFSTNKRTLTAGNPRLVDPTPGRRRVRCRGPRHPRRRRARASARRSYAPARNSRPLGTRIRARGVFVPGRVDANAAGDEYAPGTRRAGVDRRRVPDPVPGTERLETGSEHVRDANHPRSHPRPHPVSGVRTHSSPRRRSPPPSPDDPPPKPPMTNRASTGRRWRSPRDSPPTPVPSPPVVLPSTRARWNARTPRNFVARKKRVGARNSTRCRTVG